MSYIWRRKPFWADDKSVAIVVGGEWKLFCGRAEYEAVGDLLLVAVKAADKSDYLL